MKVCAASSTCTTRLCVDVQMGCGSRHISFQSMMPSLGIVLITQSMIEGQPGMVDVNLRTSSGAVTLCQDSVDMPIFCVGRKVSHEPWKC